MTVRRTHPAPDRPPAWVLWLLAAAVLLPGGAAQSGQEALSPEPGQVVASAVHPLWDGGARTVTDQVPLVEVFTATWCPPCAPADRAVDRLLEERSPGLRAEANDSRIELAVLEYHPVPDPGAEDPFGVPEGVDRLTRKYGAFWFPSAYVQGTMEDAPATRSQSVEAGMEQVFYHGYSDLIDRASANEQPLVMTTEVRHVNGTVTLDVRVEAKRGVSGPLYLQGAMWQDEVFFRGSNGVDTHRMTVLALTERRIDADGLTTGDVWTSSWTLAAPPGMDPERAGMTVFVEAAWDQPADDGSEALMTFAAGTATAAAVAVWLMRRRGRPVRLASSAEAST